MINKRVPELLVALGLLNIEKRERVTHMMVQIKHLGKELERDERESKYPLRDRPYNRISE